MAPRSVTFEDVSKASYKDEYSLVKQLLAELEQGAYDREAVASRAKELVKHARLSKDHHGLETFFQEYGLNSHEGMAIMRLSEALIRIPDSDIANELVHDALYGTSFKQHIGLSKSAFVNASALGMQLATRLFSLGKVMQMLSDPIVRLAIKQTIAVMSDEFVFASTPLKAMHRSKAYEAKQYVFSFDMLGEGARSEVQAKGYFKRYMQLLETIRAEKRETAGISIKLTALTSHLSWHKKVHLEQTLYPKFKAIVAKAVEYHIPISIDAEETFRHDITRWLVAKLFDDNVVPAEARFGIAVQAYQVGALKQLHYLTSLAQAHHRVIDVRLVKGAYWDQEIKLAQEEGLNHYPVFTKKTFTDLSYIACADYILRHKEYLYGQFGTHNAHSIAAVEHLAKAYGVASDQMEFQLLYGMGEKIYRQLKHDYTCRIYAPVGEHRTLLPYLIRRLIENGASSSFVNRFVDQDISVEKLLEDPLIAASGLLEEPIDQRFILPRAIFKDRHNSRGITLGHAMDIMQWQQQLGNFIQKDYEVHSLVSSSHVMKQSMEHYLVVSPHDTKRVVGNVSLISKEGLEEVIQEAAHATYHWQLSTVQKRAEYCLKISDLLAKHHDELVSLLQKEAGKTIHDAIAEVREAIDFCRYYALQAKKLMEPTRLDSVVGEENHLTLHPKGMFVCISPWNFPLAIFTGQVIAGLVTGNVVIAKPARATSLIAHRVVQLMHEAGIPHDVLQLVFSSGKDVSEVLLRSDAIHGVCFTGSLSAAKQIESVLSARKGAIATLIAETGGLNAMIIDSSVLVEKTVDDLVQSAFMSAGQRCSACRVAFIQEEIADELIKVLCGALDDLEIGNPEFMATDIGPVISEDAQAGLEAHIEHMQKKHQLLYKKEIAANRQGYFVAPHVFEVGHLEDIGGEQFGPILHVIRYKADQLDYVLSQINESGYGLTLGIQTRIESRIRYISDHTHVGNIYVNRSMIGAVVGSQPFGGEGLSGTGFKAGGPYYLLRFLSERVVSHNKTVIGGNVELYV